ncbi:hypothetical protein pdam_00023718, partial [Pocillopora damicornis]
HVTSDHSSNLRDVARGLLYNDHVIAHSISVLKKQRRATTFDIALSHDGNPITENVCFIHKNCMVDSKENYKFDLRVKGLRYNISPRLLRTPLILSLIEQPFTSAEPEVAGNSPVSMDISVVLPAPLCPKSTLKSTFECSFYTPFSVEKTFFRFRISTPRSKPTGSFSRNSGAVAAVWNPTTDKRTSCFATKSIICLTSLVLGVNASFV